MKANYWLNWSAIALLFQEYYDLQAFRNNMPGLSKGKILQFPPESQYYLHWKNKAR